MTTTPSLQDEAAFISGVNSSDKLVRSAFYGWDGNSPATYASTYTKARKFGSSAPGTSGGTVSYWFNAASKWTTTEQQWLSAGLALWSALANITFVKSSSAGAADITFNRESSGSTYTYSNFTSPSLGGLIGGSTLSQITGSQIYIDTSVGGFGPINGFSAYGGYPIESLLHEEGHALGLGHAGPYDGSVNPAKQQFSAYDNRLWSIMSYIDPNTGGAEYYSQYTAKGNFGGNYATTPRPADILAIQELYGVPTSTPLSGGQVFGFNTNITGAIEPFYDFTKNTNPVVTIWDKGGDNTLDLSGFGGGANVNLNPGSFSSTNGMTDNIAIAYGTSVDTLVCTDGGTTVTCNNAGDTVYTGSGDDVIKGGSGSDTAVFSGNYSSYTITHGSGGTITVSGGGSTDTLSSIETLKFADKTIGSGGGATVPPPPPPPTGSSGSALQDFNADHHSDILLQSGGSVQVWLMNGASLNGSTKLGGPGSGWQPLATGDFDASGKSDILWQSGGGLQIWTMNGTSKTSAQSVAWSVASGWKAVAAADFDGNGKADILFRNTNGQLDIWTMSGATPLSGTYAGPNLGSSWDFIATGDFNGDHKSDILWQNASGQIKIWEMNGASVAAQANVGDNMGTVWQAIGTGDFNGDGKSDILFQNTYSGDVMAWTMNGLAIQSTAIVGSPGTAWQVVGTGDYNGDHKADILYQNVSTGQLRIQLMSGTTTLSAATLGTNPGSSWHAMAG
jgi:hypothetical protein